MLAVSRPEHPLAEPLGVALAAPHKLDDSHCNGFPSLASVVV